MLLSVIKTGKCLQCKLESPECSTGNHVLWVQMVSEFLGLVPTPFMAVLCQEFRRKRWGGLPVLGMMGLGSHACLCKNLAWKRDGTVMYRRNGEEGKSHTETTNSFPLSFSLAPFPLTFSLSPFPLSVFYPLPPTPYPSPLSFLPPLLSLTHSLSLSPPPPSLADSQLQIAILALFCQLQYR